MSEENYRRAAEALRKADAVLVAAGAGMGVDSGLPDFRGNQGFWRAYPPIARLGIPFFDMANPKWFASDPKLAWAFYGHRLKLYRRTRPHRGFYRLLEVAGGKRGGYFVFTSNVDGQFQKAGYGEERIEECHGSIHHFQCTGPCSPAIWDARDVEVEVDEDEFAALDPLPRCPHCGGLARPNILMFGDWSWIESRSQRQGERLTAWLRALAAGRMRLAVVEIGAGKAVPTVRHTSESVALSHGAALIRINPRDWDVPGSSHIPIPTGAEEGITRICPSREIE